MNFGTLCEEEGRRVKVDFLEPVREDVEHEEGTQDSMKEGFGTRFFPQSILTFRRSDTGRKGVGMANEKSPPFLEDLG